MRDARGGAAIDWSDVDRVRNAVGEACPEPEVLVEALSAVDRAKATLAAAEAELMIEARKAGLTWGQIAEALRLASPQAALQRAVRLRRRAGPGD